MREKYKFKPFIIFFTGISASGKSTICLNLKKKFKKFGFKKVKNIDGDYFRKKLQNFNYKNISRDKVGDYKISIARKFFKKKYIVLVSGVAHKKSWRKKIKETNKDYFEVYLKCSVKICEKRDYKKQYIKAKSGVINNFIGVNEPYQVGRTNDLTINTSSLSIAKSINKVLNFLIKKKYVYKK